MIVLGIETATAVCGVALVQHGDVLAERWIEERFVHAEKVFGFLDDVLETSGVGLRDIAGIAVSIGPGSFTGLRIGLSVVKGLHVATGIPVVAVPTLWALARNGEAESREADVGSIVAVLDARREECYWQVFGVSGEGIRPATGVGDDLMGHLAHHLPEGRFGITGEARHRVAEVLQREGVHSSRWHLFSEARARCSAVAVARCGAEDLAAGVSHDAGQLEPQYIKDFFLRTPE